jgi:hypothetical protein
MSSNMQPDNNKIQGSIAGAKPTMGRVQFNLPVIMEIVGVMGIIYNRRIFRSIEATVMATTSQKQILA